MPLRGVKLKVTISARGKGRGSLFVARKSSLLDPNGLWLNFTAGRLLGVPYAQGQGPCIFFAVHRTAATCHLQPAFIS